MIQTDDQMPLVHESAANLRIILLETRKVHSRREYARMADPVLLEVQQREPEILEYFSGDLEQPTMGRQLTTRESVFDFVVTDRYNRQP